MVNSRFQTQQGQPVTKLETPLQTILVGNVNLIPGRFIKRVQSGILKEGPRVKTSLGVCIFRHISAMGVVNLLECLYSVNNGSSWISTADGVRKKTKWTQGQYKQKLYRMLFTATPVVFIEYAPRSYTEIIGKYQI